MSRLPWAKLGLFAGGVLFGTAGIKILSSKDAKKCYTKRPQPSFVQRTA